MRSQWLLWEIFGNLHTIKVCNLLILVHAGCFVTFECDGNYTFVLLCVTLKVMKTNFLSVNFISCRVLDPNTLILLFFVTLKSLCLFNTF